jgi:hypothetical protein
MLRWFPPLVSLKSDFLPRIRVMQGNSLIPVNAILDYAAHSHIKWSPQKYRIGWVAHDMYLQESYDSIKIETDILG